MRILPFMLALMAPAAAVAADEVSLSSEIFVERAKQDPQGKTIVVREVPGVVTPGDKLVFVLNYRNAGHEPAVGFTVTNPMPGAVAFAEAEGDGAIVSVDGGRSWGALAALKIALPDGTSRPAAAADVTHVRWSFAQPIPAGNAGKLSFRGIVK
jgi:uncharacterized repeat protein (TIGR01451 family)